MSLIEGLMGRAPKDESVEHDRVFPDVNLESRRGPLVMVTGHPRVTPDLP